MANMDKRPEGGFSIDKMIKFCKDHVRYLSGGVLMVTLVAALALTTSCKSGGKDAADDNKPTTQEEGQNGDAPATDADADGSNADSPKEEVDEHPEITELISTYYNSYAAGDLDKLAGIARKLSDMEKDYIKMMNEHVESYGNVSCTVADGAEEGTYIVSAVYEMKFAGVDDTLPGMNVFYVQTNKKGELYINNRYSSFNRELQERKTKKKIITLMEEFENSDAIKQLQQEVQSEYDKKVAANEDLQKKLNEVADAIANWKDTYTPPEKEEETKQPEENADDGQQPEENADDGQQAEQPEENADDGQQEEQPEENADDGQQADDGSQDDGGTGLNYVPEGTVLTANDGYNVRKSMDETSELVGTTAVGDSIKVVLSYAEGWTKVEWNGTTGYIRTDLLLSN